MQSIVRVLAGNGVRHVHIPQTGIMSTPAVSAAIRANPQCQGGIVLTASHNPGGPGEDFGIKYNLQFGQPAGEDFTDALYERSLKIDAFQTLLQPGDDEKDIIDLNAPVGTTFPLTSTCTVTIVDPFVDYVAVLKQCFDFEKLKAFAARPTFSLLFDGMHGAGGPFARRVLIDELGMNAEKTLMRCNPLPDFGGGHPDPNLSYAAQLVAKMGLLPDGSANPQVDLSALPTLGAANDGDGDRNLIAGAGCFVTPSDSLAVICDQWPAIPHFCQKSPPGPRGVARSMPSSAALDVVAKARGIPCFSTPTGWKFFGNLMSSKELFDKTDYTPFLCGEESFGTGSDHIREKDGLWAALAWMSILAKANEETPVDAPLVSVRDIVQRHWATYGRHFYCRYDYENVDSDAANQVMDLIRNQFVTVGSIHDAADDNGIQLVDAEEFSYTDPVDGSKATNQGLILQFLVNGDPARVVFRLSGTGSAGATIRMYLEKFEQDVTKHDESAPNALQALANRAIQLVHMQELTGRDAPTVIT
jgi:phosphoglucomutase